MTQPTLVEANRIWSAALGELQLQMTRATFDTWLRNTTIIEEDAGTWSVLCRHQNAADWLSHRLKPVVLRTFQRRQPGVDLVFVTLPPANGDALDSPEASADPEPIHVSDHSPAPDLDLDDILEVAGFDPATSGWWQAGYYATWYWASLLGPIAWRLYELVVADDKRRKKDLWTPPRRYSISELARAIAAGRGGGPNRNQIRGRWRTIKETGERIWKAGAFDTLAEHNVAQVQWHDGGGAWRPWFCGGFDRPGRSGLRVVYRLSVVTSFPLLTPAQVGTLTAEHQVSHERYLAERGVDLAAWEQIPLPTLAGIEHNMTSSISQLVRRQ